jgi:hypothetical protein
MLDAMDPEPLQRDQHPKRRRIFRLLARRRRPGYTIRLQRLLCVQLLRALPSLQPAADPSIQSRDMYERPNGSRYTRATVRQHAQMDGMVLR